MEKEFEQETVKVQPQYTESEFEELVSQAATAKSVGMGLAIWEIILLFFFKKTLFSMWILILTLQFFVYMATWNIRYPRVMKFLLHELRKISLGEFLDDLEIGGNILRLLGINSEKKTVTEEVVGEDRLGSRKDIFANFGSTLILASLGMVFVVIVVCLIIIFLRRVTCSEKCK